MYHYVQQPVPALYSQQRSVASSVERLEQTAERMSIGSDIGAEIRKIWQEQKRRESIGSSAGNSPRLSYTGSLVRQRSNDSRKRSIREISSASRRDSFSPNAYTASPAPSFHSSTSDRHAADWSNISGRDRGWSNSLRSEHDQDLIGDTQHGFNTTDVQFPTVPPPPMPDLPYARRRQLSSPRPPPHARLSPVDEAAAGNLSPSAPSQLHCQDHISQQSREALAEDSSFSQPMLAAPVAERSFDRSVSTASRSTLQTVNSLFRDFDGVHYNHIASEPMGQLRSDDIDENDHYNEDIDDDDDDDQYKLHLPNFGGREFPDSEGADDTSTRLDTREVKAHGLDIDFDREEDDRIHEKVDIMPSTQTDLRWVAPPPDENMVYYPAPVPMNLNIPQKLSKQPKHTVTAARRSKLLDTMIPNAGQSALWLAGGKSVENLAEVKDKSGSDDLVDANPNQNGQSKVPFTRLPPQLRASVFFDQDSVPHQIEVKNGSAVATLDSLLAASARAPADHSPGDLMKQMSEAAAADRKKHGKSSALAGLFDSRPEANRSRLSFLTFRKDSSTNMPQRGDSTDIEPADKESVNDNGEVADEDDARAAGETNPAAEIPSLDGPVDGRHSITPNTLLAELELRKKQLRSRNKYAADAYRNGMHATLLELDAVEEIERKRRQAQRTTLAWEDSNEVERSRQPGRNDEEVPLAVLYAKKQDYAKKGSPLHWDRPLGLVERKQLEESEPLSKRRDRLRGYHSRNQSSQQLIATPMAEDEHSEHEGETLAQRTRRLKSATQSDHGPLLPIPMDKPGEETLGQRRRRRLQSQSQGFGEAHAPPGHRPSASLANLPSASTVFTLRSRVNVQGGQTQLSQPPLRQSKSFMTGPSMPYVKPMHPAAMPNMGRNMSSSNLTHGMRSVSHGFPQQPHQQFYGQNLPMAPQQQYGMMYPMQSMQMQPPGMMHYQPRM